MSCKLGLGVILGFIRAERGVELTHVVMFVHGIRFFRSAPIHQLLEVTSSKFVLSL